MWLKHPTPIQNAARKFRRRLKKVYYDPRQLQFEFMRLIEIRPRRLSLAEMDIDACKALWYAVLKSGIECYLSDVERASEDDKHWLVYDVDEKYREYVGSFRWCCGVLGMDAQQLRQRIVKL